MKSTPRLLVLCALGLGTAFIASCGEMTPGEDSAVASTQAALLATEHGIATTASTCTTPATPAQLLAKFPPGSSQVQLGTYKLTATKRNCNTHTGCAAFSNDDAHYFSGYPQTGAAWLTLGSAGKVNLTLISDRCIDDKMGMGMTCRQTREPAGFVIGWPYLFGASCGTGPVSCGTYSYVSSMQWGGSGGLYPTQGDFAAGSQFLKLTGNVGTRCLKLSGSGKTTPDSSGSYIENVIESQLTW